MSELKPIEEVSKRKVLLEIESMLVMADENIDYKKELAQAREEKYNENVQSKL